MNAINPTKLLLEFYQFSINCFESDKFPLEVETGQQKKTIDAGTITDCKQNGFYPSTPIPVSQFNYQ